MVAEVLLVRVKAVAGVAGLYAGEEGEVEIGIAESLAARGLVEIIEGTESFAEVPEAPVVEEKPQSRRRGRKADNPESDPQTTELNHDDHDHPDDD